MYALLIVVHLVCCLGLIVIVLLQAGKGGGLSGAFGASAVESSLGAGASDVLKKATTVMAVMFMLTSLSLAFVTAQRSASVVKDTVKPSQPIPAQNAPATPDVEKSPLGETPKGTLQKILKEVTNKIPMKKTDTGEAVKETPDVGPGEEAAPMEQIPTGGEVQESTGDIQ